MRNLLRIVLAFSALLGVSGALAQQTIVFSVDGWPRLGTRADGKVVANAFTWGLTSSATSASGGGGGIGKLNIQDAVLTMPIGDAAMLFAQSAMRGQHLKSVLVEFPSARDRPGGPAPFAARLTDVLITSVNLSKAGGDGGPGVAEIKLNAGRIELFTSNQAPDGSMRPGQKTGYDAKVNKAF